MSLISKNSIQVAAQSLGISNLGDEVAQALAPDVEYRIREICQEAIKCMRHSKRSTLTTDDVNSALSLRNVEPLYGFSSSDPLRFRKALGHSDLYYVDDKELAFNEIIDAPLPKPPVDTTVVAHWLAIDGVQPAIQENPPPGAELNLPPEQKKKFEGQAGLATPEDLPVEVKPAVKHVISKELQLYFEKIMELVTSGTDSKLLNDAVRSLATDSGIHPLVPYFIQFIQDEVQRSLYDLPLLFTLMRIAEALLANPHVHIESYLQQLIPSVVTCLVARRLGSSRKNGYRHWDLRDFSASIVATICHRYGHSYSNIQPRITKTLVSSFLNPKQTYPQHYGSIKGLVALGNRIVRLLVLPNLATYLELLREDLDPQKQKDEVRRYEAQRVYGLLQVAAGNCMFEALKNQPQLGELLLRSRPMVGKKVNTTRKGGDQKEDGLSAMDTNASKALEKAQEGPSGLSESSGVKVESNGKAIGRKRARAGGMKEDAEDVLAEAWKEEGDTWRLFGKLVDLFGDSMLSFIPRPQLTLMHSYC